MSNVVLSFGEILYDIFPADERLGGAPFNFAYHLHAFDFQSRLISRVGVDARGVAIVSFLQRNIGVDLLQRDPLHPTGTVRVAVDDRGVPDFTIVEGAAYDYIEADDAVLQAVESAPALIYFGTLAQRSAVSRSALDVLLARAGSARILYDMNLRGNYFSREVIENSLTACHIVKLNDEELNTCKRLLQYEGEDDVFVEFLMERYPLEWVCLTRGAQGSVLYHGGERYCMEEAPVQAVIDTVGAGDAYTAILAMGILRDWAPGTILERATEFAGAVCGLSGAIPEDRSFYRPYLHWKEAVKR